MSETKRVGFNCPIELYEKFLQVFPYKGEPTAFFLRCVEAVVQGQVPHEDMEKIQGLIDKAKKDIQERR